MIDKKPVKLVAVCREVVGESEDGFEDLLDDGDAFANSDERVGVGLLEELGGGEVVCVGVGLENVMKGEVVVFDKGEDFTSGLGPDVGGGGVVVEDRVDDDRVEGAGIVNNVGEGVGTGIKERVDGGGHADLLGKGRGA